MTALSWLAKLVRGRTRRAKPRLRSRLAPEILEDRLVPTFTITDLGVLPGGESSTALGLNDAGQIVGISSGPFQSGGSTHAFLYSPGSTMTDLGSLPGVGNGTQAFGINSSGQVVGVSGFSAFSYSGGVMTGLGGLPGRPSSVAYGINSSGQIVGFASGVRQDDHAFMYTNGVMQDLGVPSGLLGSRGFAINDSGQVVGTAVGTAVQHAVLYSGGEWTDLNNALGLTGTSTATAINNAGQIVGYSDEGTFLDNDGEVSIIGHFNPTGINDSGQVVGGTGSSALLYSNGSLTDLNTVVLNGAGWSLQYAYGINNSGQVVGTGSINGEVHGFLLTPLASGSVIVGLTAASVTYTGSPYNTANLTTTVLPATASGSVSYVFFSDAGGHNTISTPINAGTYYVQAVFTSSDPARFTNAASGVVAFTITPKSLSVDATTQGTLNIAKAGTISFALQITDGLFASNSNVSALFNGATFTITVGGASYSLTSTATVAPDGSINVSIKMSQGLQNALLAALSEGNTVDFSLSALSNDGDYSIAADAISRLISQGKLKFAVV